ncbi:hypothetical protein DICSQDRAFT_139193 [Dichomitus squalens LYAD-421 SS1]|uniref:Uncharacterized protein n=1 Tax=Dichomitus squalens (strain LYAD-421) TaxID=732165 RepID=R7SS39_DICSQ|nr:uncharacterized protein DICSQDRAFT_139193 [Dichomitus squalens LYAD-421 SS1]EJF58753.1 hypothetical protein DICSQDRAFT_139193 [Dichomitus squalens LYAD-421 SS1]
MRSAFAGGRAAAERELLPRRWHIHVLGRAGTVHDHFPSSMLVSLVAGELKSSPEEHRGSHAFT